MDEHGPETVDELKAELIVVLRRADSHLCSSEVAQAMGDAMAYYLSDDFLYENMTEDEAEAEAARIADLIREVEPEATAAVIRRFMGKKDD